MIELVYDFASLPVPFLERFGTGRDGSDLTLREVFDPWRVLRDTSLLVDLCLVWRFGRRTRMLCARRSQSWRSG